LAGISDCTHGCIPGPALFLGHPSAIPLPREFQDIIGCLALNSDGGSRLSVTEAARGPLRLLADNPDKGSRICGRRVVATVQAFLA